jgi:hypothetical protein
VKPAHVPQEKNGEHPAQSLVLSLPACSVFTALSQLLSVQHGLTDRNTTMKENKMQSSFTAQKYQLNL